MKELLAGTAIAGLLFAPGLALAGATGGGIEATFDVNGDGKSDLVGEKIVDPNSGLIRTVRIDGTSVLGNGFPLLVGANFTTTGAGNFTAASNGQASLAFRKTAGTNEGIVRISSLDSTAENVTANTFPMIPPLEFSLIGIGDVNADDVDDFVYVRTTTPNEGLVRIYLMNSSMGVAQSAFPTSIPTTLDPIGVADADGDGDADILAYNPSTGLVRVIRLAADVSAGVVVEGNTFPVTLPAGFEIVGLAPVNADSRADIVLVKTGAPNSGLVRVILMGADAASVDGSEFPLFIPSGFSTVGLGNYDDVDQYDLMVQKDLGEPNAGLLRVFLLSSDGSGVSSTGFPTTIDPSVWALRQTAAVIP